MSQIAQLSEAEIEERFHITGPTSIQFTLAGYASHKESFSVQFADGQEHFLTILLEVDQTARRLIIDCSGSAELNRNFAESQRNVFVARPGGIRVQFTCGQAKLIFYKGAPAFSLELPKFIMRLQRREFFRIETPRSHPLQFYIRLPNETLLTLPAHDISVDGIGLAANSDHDLSAGIALSNCRFALPEDDHDVLIKTVVRHVTTLELRAGVTQWRIGLRFESLPLIEENHLQRYIAHIEHERHELS